MGRAMSINTVFALVILPPACEMTILISKLALANGDGVCSNYKSCGRARPMSIMENRRCTHRAWLSPQRVRRPDLPKWEKKGGGREEGPAGSATSSTG
jgi:hypothetical protein